LNQIENPYWLQSLPRMASKATLKKNDAAGRGSDRAREDGLAVPFRPAARRTPKSDGFALATHSKTVAP